MTEKGDMLTQFEECFGSVLEHEVIKMILQNVNWDGAEALQAATAMIDMASIPQNVQARIHDLSFILLGASPVSTAAAEGLQLNINETSCDKNTLRNTIIIPDSKAQNKLDIERNQVDVWNDTDLWRKPVKNFKSNNSNVNYKLTNISSPNFTNEHRNYDKFLSDTSQLNKDTSSSQTNDSSHSFATDGAEPEKASCLLPVINAMLADGMLVMVVMRGLPGSGKSTLAHRICSDRGVVLSTDDFFLAKNGTYYYNSNSLSEAHNWNQQRSRTSMKNKKNPVVIDNTNLQAWEMKPYVFMGFDYGYKVVFLEPDTPWKMNARELARRSRHSVPKSKVEEMMARFQRNVKLKDFELLYVSKPVTSNSFSIPKTPNSMANNTKQSYFRNNVKKNIGLNSIWNNIDRNSLVKQTNLPCKNDHCSHDLLKETVNKLKAEQPSEFLIDSREDSPILNNEEFNSMVASLGNVVQNHIDNRNTDQPRIMSLSTTEEDLKMYEFCEDIEDKLGNTISSLIRQPLSKCFAEKECVPAAAAAAASTDITFLPVNCTTKIVKTPALDTVSEELTKDLVSCKTAEESDCSDRDDTSNDASSVELSSEDDRDNEHKSDKVDNWDCSAGAAAATTDWDVADKLSDVKISCEQPLEARDHSRRHKISVSPVLIEEISESMLTDADHVDKLQSWSAGVGTANWNENDLVPEYADSDLRKTGAVPKRSRGKMKRVNKDISEKNDEFPLYVSKNLPLSKYSLCTFEVLPKPLEIYDNYITVSVQTQLDEIMKDKSLKILYGNAEQFKLGMLPEQSDEGPITKHILMLEKGTMTCKTIYESSTGKVHHLKGFFPTLPDSELQDILENCNYDVDWAMNVLLDGGYQISEGSESIINKDVVTCDDNSADIPVVSIGSDGELTSSDSSNLSGKKKRKRHRKSFINVDKKKQSDERGLLSEESGSLDDSGQTRRTFLKSPQSSRESSAASNACETSENICMELDPLFANQLINLFGTVGNLNMNHTFCEEERRVSLPLGLCKEIHSLWIKAFKGHVHKDEKLLKRYIDTDVTYALQLHEQEKQKAGNPSYFGGFECIDPPTDLREIMSLEKALQVSEKREPKTFMADRLSEQRLCKEFCHINASVVKDILQKCNWNYVEATSDLLLKFGVARESSRKKREEEEKEEEEGFDEKSCLDTAARVAQEAQTAEKAALQDIDSQYGSGQDDHDDLQRCRSEYEAYYNLRKEYMDKAKLVAGPNRQIVAHYAREANKFTKKMYELDMRINLDVVKQQQQPLSVNCDVKDPNTLDLHLLPVPAAVMACERFLQERQRALQASSTQHKLNLTFVTGWGKHSPCGTARIKPALRNFLVKKGFTCNEPDNNPGVMKVILTL